MVHEYREQGRLIENEATYPCVFVSQGQERPMLAISYSDPAGTALKHSSPWRDLGGGELRNEADPYSIVRTGPE